MSTTTRFPRQSLTPRYISPSGDGTLKPCHLVANILARPAHGETLISGIYVITSPASTNGKHQL